MVRFDITGAYFRLFQHPLLAETKVESEVSKSTVYNNHYFIDPNNRRIITHKVRDGKTLIFQIQDFVRVQQP